MDDAGSPEDHVCACPFREPQNETQTHHINVACEGYLCLGLRGIQKDNHPFGGANLKTDTAAKEKWGFEGAH